MVEENFDNVPDEALNMIDDLQFQSKQAMNQNFELSNALASAQDTMDNNISYQLETDKILERVEHFLKGEQVKFNKNGAYFSPPTKNVLCLVKKDPIKGLKYYYQEVKESKIGTEITKEVLIKIEKINGEGKETEVMLNEADSKILSDKLSKVKLVDCGYKYVEVIDEEKKPLNEYGVSEIMRIMSMYVTKETILSCYTEERINEILYDLGSALIDFFYCNYEKMGMDTKFKESKYTLICLNLLHVVESCYRRAIGGEERENIRTRSIVTQSNTGIPMNISKQQVKKKWNPFDKNTW